MDLTGLPIFQLLHEKMTWLTQRQKVISENLANADTPGYRARRLEEPDFSAYLNGVSERLSLATTDASHIKGRGVIGGVRPAEAAIHGRSEPSPDGNSVDLAEESIKIAETQGQYNLAANLYRKHVQLLHTALGRQNG